MASDLVVEKVPRPTISSRARAPLAVLVAVVAVVAVVGLLLSRLSTTASAARFAADIPMPPGMLLQAADSSQTSALLLDDAAVVAAARAKSPDFVGRDPLIRFGVVSNVDAAPGRFAVPASPTPSWILVSPDVVAPVSVPAGADVEIVSQVGYVFLDESGAVYQALLLTYFNGDPVPPLPAQ